MKAITLSNLEFNSPPSFGFVSYINPEGAVTTFGPYKKRYEYNVQNEFRLKFDIKDNESNLCNFHVGNLSDIVTVTSTDKPKGLIAKILI